MHFFLFALISLAATLRALPSPLYDGYDGPSRIRVSGPRIARGIDRLSPSSNDVDIPGNLDWDPKTHKVVKRPGAKWQYHPAEDVHDPKQPIKNKPDRMWYEIPNTDGADIQIMTYDESHRRIVEKPYYRKEKDDLPEGSQEAVKGAWEGIWKRGDAKRSDYCRIVDRGWVGTGCDVKKCEAEGGVCRMTVHGCFSSGPAWGSEACAGCKCPTLVSA